MAATGFQLVTDEDEAPAPSKPDAATGAGLSLLTLGLKTLSQRVLVAFSSLFTLATVGSAWWLWHATPDPNAYQIVSLSIYALFVLAANWIARRR